MALERDEAAADRERAADSRHDAAVDREDHDQRFRLVPEPDEQPTTRRSRSRSTEPTNLHRS
jgi:hypothetical protein